MADREEVEACSAWLSADKKELVLLYDIDEEKLKAGNPTVAPVPTDNGTIIKFEVGQYFHTSAPIPAEDLGDIKTSKTSKEEDAIKVILKRKKGLFPDKIKDYFTKTGNQLK